MNARNKKSAPAEPDSAQKSGAVRLSLRLYGEHRRTKGLRGYSLLAVQQAIQRGRITRQCELHEHCPIDCRRGKIPPERADAQWVAHTTPGADRKADAAPELITAKVIREQWAGRNERLRFEERAKSLVRADAVQQQLYARGRQLRDSLTQVRLRLSSQLAVERDPRRIDRMLAEAFDEVLEVMTR